MVATMTLQNIKHIPQKGSLLVVDEDEPQSTGQDQSELLSLKDASELLPGVSRHTLRRWAKANMVTHIELPGGRLWFRREDILELMKPVIANENGVV